MKKTLILAVITLSILTGALAQDSNANKSFALGMQIGQYQKDFGMGIHVSSPYFLYKKVTIRVKYNFMWHEHLDASNDIVWTSYSNLSVGLVGLAGEISDFARIYGEGGLLFLFPSSKFSSESSEMGGYGLLGFELMPNAHTAYFIEVGGAGTGARADKIPGEAVYSNGLIITAGLRFNF